MCTKGNAMQCILPSHGGNKKHPKFVAPRFEGWTLKVFSFPTDTLPKTNIAPENGWLENDPVILVRPIFRCYVSFVEGSNFLVFPICSIFTWPMGDTTFQGPLSLPLQFHWAQRKEAPPVFVKLRSRPEDVIDRNKIVKFNWDHLLKISKEKKQ